MSILITARRGATADRRLLRRAARAALRAEGLPAAAELSVLVTDDEEIRRLNREHRGVDAATDVLAFPQDAAPPRAEIARRAVKGPAPSLRTGQALSEPKGPPYMLGDVVISAPAALRQARPARSGDGAPHPAEEEMELLVIHGVLHLAGWRDDTAGERRRMLRRGRQIWRAAQDSPAQTARTRPARS